MCTEVVDFGCSLDRNMDYIRLCRVSQRSMRNCCVFIFSETWLGRNITDAAVGLEGMTLHRADIDATLTGKQRGGGLAIYINNSWCLETEVVSTVCTPDIEALTVRCRPFYLPRELSAIIIVAVYIAPSANVTEAMEVLHDIISTQQTAHPDAFFIAAGDYNQASLKTVLPKFHQHVNFATRGSNTLDLVYTNIKDSYRAAPLAHVGNSDHRAVLLTPRYRPRVKQAKAEIERLVMQHIKSCLPANLDPLQFAYKSNCSTEDAITTTLHSILSHLEAKNTYARVLFIDFSSAFNTIIPQLVEKLRSLNMDTNICNWVLSFLTQRQQSVRMGKRTSSSITVNTGSPQGCVLSPLLFSLLTHDCTASHTTNKIIKYANNTTVVGLIKDEDETAYRREVEQLTRWCRSHNLLLNVDKTKELVMDFRKSARPEHNPLIIDGAAVGKVSSVKFLGVHLAEDLSFTTNTAAITKKAQQRLHLLRKLRKAGLPTAHLTTFYKGTVESILTYNITSWFGSCKEYDRRQLNRVVKTASRIVGAALPSLTNTYNKQCISRVAAIFKDTDHPSDSLFSMLPS